MQQTGNQSEKRNISQSSRSKNYELFSLSKILRISKSTIPSSKFGTSEDTWQFIEDDVFIDIVAYGGFKGHEFIAIYCSNGKKI
jgi:hypothetical protein